MGTEQSPEAVIGHLESTAQIAKTPCGSGHMVWRIWGSGPDLVLFHGNLGSWKHWIRNIPALAARYRVIAADIPGFGESDLPAAPYSAASLAQVIADGLAEISAPASALTFAGFSFGSGVACETAQVLGARVPKVVLVSAGYGIAEVTRNEIAPFVKWRDQPTPEARDAAHRRNMEILMIANPARIDELALHIHSKSAEQARLRISVINKTKTHTTCTPHLQCALDAIWGEKDALIGPNMHQRINWLHSHHPAARCAVIPDAGHWCGYEAPERFNSELLKLLAPAS